MRSIRAGFASTGALSLNGCALHTCFDGDFGIELAARHQLTCTAAEAIGGIGTVAVVSYGLQEAPTAMTMVHHGTHLSGDLYMLSVLPYHFVQTASSMPQWLSLF